jgi:hypothetical protein
MFINGDKSSWGLILTNILDSYDRIQRPLERNTLPMNCAAMQETTKAKRVPKLELIDAAQYISNASQQNTF